MTGLLTRYRERRDTKRLGPMTYDRCEVCGKPLRQLERVEVCDPFTALVNDGVLSGGGIIVSYCQAHAPEEH